MFFMNVTPPRLHGYTQFFFFARCDTVSKLTNISVTGIIWTRRRNPLDFLAATTAFDISIVEIVEYLSQSNIFVINSEVSSLSTPHFDVDLGLPK